MRAMERFGVATFQEIRLRAYGLSIPAAKALILGGNAARLYRL